MKKLFLPLLLALGVITLFNGCSSGMDRIGLQVQLAKLERKADGTILASLLFSNPSVGAFNVVSSTHILVVNGHPVGVLDVGVPLGLPAQTTALATATLKRTAGAGEISGTVSYQLTSTLLMSIYDDKTERYKTSSAGTVVVQ